MSNAQKTDRPQIVTEHTLCGSKALITWHDELLNKYPDNDDRCQIVQWFEENIKDNDYKECFVNVIHLPDDIFIYWNAHYFEDADQIHVKADIAWSMDLAFENLTNFWTDPNTHLVEDEDGCLVNIGISKYENLAPRGASGTRFV